MGSIVSKTGGGLKSLGAKVGGGLKKAAQGVGGFVKKHKLLSILAAVLVVGAGVAYFGFIRPAAQAAGTGTTYSFVRTTTLEKTSLEDSVSATGTVESADVSSVTVDDGVKTLPIASISVQVGDVVSEGDVICTLDTTDLEEKISKAEESLAEGIADKTTAYNQAVDSYNEAVADENKAYTEWQDALTDRDDKYTVFEAAKKKVDTLQAVADGDLKNVEYWLGLFNGFAGTVSNANNLLNSYQSAYNTALEDYQKAKSAAEGLSALESALSAANSAMSTADSNNQTVQADGNATDEEKAAAQKAYDDAAAACDAAQTAYDAAKAIADTANAAQTAVQAAATNYATANFIMTGSDLSGQLNSATGGSAGITDAAVTAAFAAYTEGLTYESKYNEAKAKYDADLQTLNTAKTQVGYYTAETEYNTAAKTVDSTKLTYDNAVKSTKAKKQSVESAATALSRASTNDSLEDYRSQLENCTLTAKTGGTVTQLNATVGSTCTGTVATIQDTENLKVSITLEEYDVSNVAIGMSCLITSDATEGSIRGTLTQISPTASSASAGSTGASASSSAAFAAEVTVEGGSNGLLVGMNASVEIIKSTTDDVFVVPIDAVGTAEDGTSYVYLKTGGTGVDATFEQVTVTTGSSNDYYTEISGEGLQEGGEVRSTADLTVGAETVDSETDSASFSFGMPGMNSQSSGTRPDGGTRPSGGPGGF